MKFSRHVKARAFGSLACLAAFLLVAVSGAVLAASPASATPAASVRPLSSAVLTASPAGATPAASVRPLGSAVRTVNLASATPVASSVTPSAVTSPCPAVVVKSDLPCALPEAHKCVDIGTWSGIHAIFCVDLIVQAVAGSNSVTVGLQASGYCQDAAGYAQCTGMTVYGGTYDPYTSDKNYHWTKGCGAGAGTGANCAPNGRNYFSHDDITVPTGSSDEIWGVIWGGGSWIELPGNSYALVGNFETGHVSVYNNL